MPKILGTTRRSFQGALLFTLLGLLACERPDAPGRSADPAPTSVPEATEEVTPATETQGEMAVDDDEEPDPAEGNSNELGAVGPPHPPISERPAGRIIDAHAHLMGYEVWEDVEVVLNENDIDFIFNLSGGSPRRGQSLAMMLARDSGGRVANLMTVDWSGIDEFAFGEILAAELEMLVTRFGYVGLKISKGLGLSARDGYGELIDVDDPRLFPLWAKAGELGVPVFIHTSDPLAFWEPITPENERYAELSVHPNWSFHGPEYPPREELLEQRNHLLELFPETNFVGVHFGNNPEDIHWVDDLLNRYPNFYVDLAARVPELGRHPPDEVRDVFMRHQDRILFATDIVVVKQRGLTSYTLGSGGEEPDTYDEIEPFYHTHDRWLSTDDHAFAHPTPIQGDWTIDAINLPQEVLDKIYYLNAYNLVLEGRVTDVEIPEN